MVERSIEYFLLLAVHRLYLNAGKRFFPFVIRCLSHSIEIPSRHFSFHVGACLLAAIWRKGHLDHKFAVLAEVKVKNIHIPVILKCFLLGRNNRFAEFGPEMPSMLLSPAAGTAGALDVQRVHHLQCADRAAVPAYAGLKVHNQGSPIGIEAVLVQSYALGRGQSCLHSVCRQLHAV